MLEANLRLPCVLLVATFSLCSRPANAQASPTATRPVQLAIFGGLTGSDTGLSQNLSVTTGLDVGFRLPLPVHSSAELRGTFPLATGNTDIQQRALLAGLKVDCPFDRFRPYVDLLAGRNQTNYDPGSANTLGTRYFIQSVSTVFSPGIGIDFTLSPRFGLQVDAQFQRYDSPVSSSGHLYATPVTAALIYHLGTGRGPR